ncbi:3-deoxy-D-manno-octulosonic acid transferase [Szabonella alba]|uniref:3-deoxy-D-manno-octulosonic acid transferase n=1 Tax=Szabonella alba TaxID=2804194 RepID=A0A8K0VCV6_9RHOB|nr:glycosyltransferase N-terminal domain-containing protein [Szabonella alba]MBL4916810.1 3-deoxy-D-manno-octulosonic acid transferase [Szabonella alba]
MAYSLGLTLYNLSSRGVALPGRPARQARPPGPLLWLHSPGMESRRQMAALASRVQQDGQCSVLLTTGPEAGSGQEAQGQAGAEGKMPGLASVLTEVIPPDIPAEVRAFLDHWRPDLAVMAEGELRPALLHHAEESGVPLTMVEARTPAFARGREGWWPGLMRAVLGAFREVHAVDEGAARALRRAGVPPQALRVAGRLEYPSVALSCTEAERAELARLLATRPVWFAADLPEEEEDRVITAHRAALKPSHRLLLILAPRDPARLAPLAERLQAREGWAVARRAAEEEPDPDCQVYLVDPGLEFGLWYRLAPITYLGGSLTPGGAGRDPMEAAALGSALIHGPRAGAFGLSLGRLAGAQATALVGSAADLGEAVADLMAPDRCARQARAAWEVASDGREATEAALAMIHRLMERAP